MSPEDVALPIIDLSGYLNPKSPEDREQVVEQVRDAARQYGFFQVKGHGIPLALQRDLVRCMGNVFDLPEEQKLAMSFLKNPSRRGYEASGMSHREGDALPDAKEVRRRNRRIISGARCPFLLSPGSKSTAAPPRGET